VSLVRAIEFELCIVCIPLSICVSICVAL
jgi:hypothetical protein